MKQWTVFYRTTPQGISHDFVEAPDVLRAVTLVWDVRRVAPGDVLAVIPKYLNIDYAAWGMNFMRSEKEEADGG